MSRRLTASILAIVIVLAAAGFTALVAADSQVSPLRDLLLGGIAGALLGMRFKVLSVLTINGLGIAMVAAIAFARNKSASSALLATILLCIGLQAGYLSGALLRSFLVDCWRGASRRWGNYWRRLSGGRRGDMSN